MKTLKILLLAFLVSQYIPLSAQTYEAISTNLREFGGFGVNDEGAFTGFKYYNKTADAYRPALLIDYHNGKWLRGNYNGMKEVCSENVNDVVALSSGGGAICGLDFLIVTNRETDRQATVRSEEGEVWTFLEVAESPDGSTLLAFFVSHDYGMSVKLNMLVMDLDDYTYKTHRLGITTSASQSNKFETFHIKEEESEMGVVDDRYCVVAFRPYGSWYYGGNTYESKRVIAFVVDYSSGAKVTDFATKFSGYDPKDGRYEFKGMGINPETKKVYYALSSWERSSTAAVAVSVNSSGEFGSVTKDVFENTYFATSKLNELQCASMIKTGTGHEFVLGYGGTGGYTAIVSYEANYGLSDKRANTIYKEGKAFDKNILAIDYHDGYYYGCFGSKDKFDMVKFKP